MYCRWIQDVGPINKAMSKIEKLISEEIELKAKATKLQR